MPADSEYDHSRWYDPDEYIPRSPAKTDSAISLARYRHGGRRIEDIYLPEPPPHICGYCDRPRSMTAREARCGFPTHHTT